MSGFLIDTNIRSELTKSNPDTRVAQWAGDPGAALYLSVVTAWRAVSACVGEMETRSYDQALRLYNKDRATLQKKGEHAA